MWCGLQKVGRERGGRGWPLLGRDLRGGGGGRSKEGGGFLWADTASVLKGVLWVDIEWGLGGGSVGWYCVGIGREEGWGWGSVVWHRVKMSNDDGGGGVLWGRDWLGGGGGDNGWHQVKGESGESMEWGCVWIRRALLTDIKGGGGGGGGWNGAVWAVIGCRIGRGRSVGWYWDCWLILWGNWKRGVGGGCWLISCGHWKEGEFCRLILSGKWKGRRFSGVMSDRVQAGMIWNGGNWV